MADLTPDQADLMRADLDVASGNAEEAIAELTRRLHGGDLAAWPAADVIAAFMTPLLAIHAEQAVTLQMIARTLIARSTAGEQQPRNPSAPTGPYLGDRRRPPTGEQMR